MSKPEIDPLVYRAGHAAELLGVSRTTLWRLRKEDPTFPPAVRLGVGSVGFRGDDLRVWLRGREEVARRDAA